MSVSPAFQAVLTPRPTVASIWVATRPTPTTFNEGATVRFTVQCFNAVPGQSKLIWKLSGAKAADKNWSTTWEAAWTAAMAGRGLTYTKVSASANNATVAGLIQVGEGYDGRPVEISITCLANKRTDVTGSPGQLQVTMQLALPAGATGTLSGNGLAFFINDTSKTPAGTPTYRLQAFKPDGVTSAGALNEGDSFLLQVTTENMVPGTRFLIFAANKGQNKIVGGFRPALKAAAEAVGCVCATDYATRGNYNGGLVTIGEAYQDASPIRVPMTITQDQLTTGKLQLDILTSWKEDGDEDNPTVRYATTVSMYINDTSIERTPSYWRVRAQAVGANLTYSLISPTGASASSVTIASTGTKPAGFDAALAAAVAATAGLSLAGDVLTSTPAWNGQLQWQVARPAGAGKHALRLTEPTADSLIVVGDACVFFTPPAFPAEPNFVTGVNLSGGDFGETKPGIYGTDYRYPSLPEASDPAARHANMDYYFQRNAGVVRLPVRWERIQDAPYGPLSSPGNKATWSGRLDMDRIDEIVAYATAQGKRVLLDVHNYMGLAGQKVGFDYQLRTDALCDLWERLANRYAGNPLVWFGIMNEPSGETTVTPARCRDIMEWVVNAVRGRTPALNRILVAGTYYDGAWSWVSQGNGGAFAGFADPAGNFLFEMHQYFDAGSKGQLGSCDVNAHSRLVAATTWARQNGYRVFLGEFAGGDPTTPGQENCANVVPAALDYMAANRDVWAGWTCWGGGARTRPDYNLRLDPVNGVDTPKFTLIAPYLTTLA